jgi:hypothetical protein
MPYIKQAKREELDWRIRNLTQAIQELSDADKPASFAGTLELNLHKTGVALIPERHYWAIALSSRSNRMVMFTDHLCSCRISRRRSSRRSRY